MRHGFQCEQPYYAIHRPRGNDSGGENNFTGRIQQAYGIYFMKLDCVIIEDLKVAADYLKRCCEKCGRLEVKGHFMNVATALEFLNEHTVDLLFLDVEMPGATGFELLDNIAYKPQVILTTSKEKYAFNAFEYHVTDFLKKPFTYNRFLESL